MSQLRACIGRKLDVRDGIQPTILHATKKEVQRENDDALAMLDTEHHSYQAQVRRMCLRWRIKCVWCACGVLMSM